MSVSGAASITASLSLRDADALHRAGRAGDAAAALASAEAAQGRTAESRTLAARLLSFKADHGAALAALGEAADLLAPAQERERRRLALACAEEWLMLGRPDEARRAIEPWVGREAPTYGELSILRRAVTSRDDLDALFATLLPLFTRPGPLGRAALFQYSMACRDGDEADRAITAARARFLAALRSTGFGSHVPRPNPGWTDEAATALADIRADLLAIGEDPFLVSGTFLGCVRDGGIIGHDKDIDLGLFPREPVAVLRQALATSGRFRVRPVDTDRLVQVRHANGVVIDLFLHWQADGLVFHEGQKGRWWNTPFALVRTAFLGHDVLVPADAERYLLENYGPGWREPDPLFETFMDTPNLVPPPDDHMRWYYFSRLHDLFAAGRIGKIEKLWAGLRPLLGADAEMERAIARIRAEAAAAARIAAAAPVDEVTS